MDYNNIFSLSKSVFVDFEVVEESYIKYNTHRKKIVFRRFNARLNKYFKFAEISNLLLGTSFIADVWVINYFIGDKTFDFRIETDLEEITLKLTLDWYLSAIEAEKLRTEYYNKYTKIKTDLKSEIRDYKISKII